MTIIAIDFGTSNTAIAFVMSTGDSDLAVLKTLQLGDIAREYATTEGTAWLVPSLVYVGGKERFLFGEQVRSLDQSQDSQNISNKSDRSKRLFQGFKRDLVANFRSPARELDGSFYDADAIAT